MAIVLYKNADKTVNNILERNAIEKKIDNMVVTVLDSIADPDAGPGVSTYRWNEYLNKWILMSRSTIDTMSFQLDELVIVNGKVTPTQVPTDNKIWDVYIMDGDVIIAQIRQESLTITPVEISGIDPIYNGKKFRCMYAFGKITQQIESYMDYRLLPGNLDLNGINGNIIPTGNGTQNIGSPTNRFGAIYVNEAYLSANTLYIGDTAILGTEDDTINIKADIGQSVNISTSGVGTTEINSESAVNIKTLGTNADVKIEAIGTNSKVRMSGTGGIEFSSPTTIQENLTLSKNLTINGNLTVNGSQMVVNSTTVTTKDNILVLNQGEAGAGVTSGKSGIQIDRGELGDYQLIFDENIDKFIVGQVGGTFETLATIEFVQNAISNIDLSLYYTKAEIGTINEFISALG